MIHLFTNTNSNVKVKSYIKENENSSFKETSNDTYTVLTKDGKIKLDIEGFEFRKEQSVNNARLICFFEKLTLNDIFVLKDENDKIIDKVIVGAKTEYGDKKITNYISFDITRFLANRAKEGTMKSLYLTWSAVAIKQSVNFIGFTYIDKLNETEEDVKSDYIMVSYANIEGIESHFAFKERKLNMSGSALVNIRQGNLIYESPISLKNVLISEIYLNLIYNSLNESIATKYGKGFRGPFEYDIDTSMKEKGIIKLTDQTLKKSYFTKLTDEERNNLTAETKKDVYYCFADSTYIVCESDGTYTFVCDRKKINLIQNGAEALVNYFLFEDGTKMSVEYENDNNISVVYATGMKDQLVFNDNHLKKFISKRLGIVTTFAYTGEQLTNIKTEKITLDFENDMKEKGTVVAETKLVYNGDKLERILNVRENKAIDFVYNNFKVIAMVECAINKYGVELTGNVDEFQYGNTYTIVKDRKGNKMYYHFDSYGSCTYTLDKNSVSNNFKFGTISDSDQNAECHKLRSKYQSQGNIPNLLYNGSFEFDDNPLTGWEIVDGKPENVSLSKDSLYGENCLHIKASNNDKFIFMQEIKQKTKGTFRLTGFYKSYKTSTSDTGKIDVKVSYVETVTKKSNDYKDSNKNVTEEITYVKDISVDLPFTDGKWEYFETELISVPDNATFEITAFCYSDIYFDELQLTKNNFLGGHNYIRNSHFENIQDGLPLSWVTYGTTEEDGVVSSKGLDDSSFLSEMIEGNVFKFSGTNESKEKGVYQKINLKGDSGEKLLVSCWLLGDKTINEKLQLEVSVHYNYLKADKLKKYIVTPTNNEEGWQVLTSLITTEYTYDYVIVKVVHNGFNTVYLDAIQMFKTKTGSTFSYDERGNLMSASNNEKYSEATYDQNNRMSRKSCTDGQQFKYTYSSSTGRLTRIEDNFGNIASFIYSDNGVVKELTSNGKTIRTTENDCGNGLVVKEDELGHKTMTAVNEFGNVATYVDAKGTVIRKVFDANQRPIEIERSSNNEASIKATISYTESGNVKEIVCPNNTKVQMTYDDFGNRLETAINYDILESDVFNDPYDSQVNEIRIRANYMSDKSILYDTNGNIKQVTIDGNKIQKYTYDELGRLVEVNDLSQNKSYHFNNDSDGTLLAITDSDGNSINYEFDNLDNVEKEIIKIGDNRVASNYVHAYEFNEADRSTFFDRLSRTYLDDIIVGDTNTKGLYGASASSTSLRYVYDEFVNFNTIELSYSGKNLCYELGKVNSERQNDLSNGGKFNKYIWKLNFEKSKTVYGWIRALGTVQDKTILEFNGNDNSIKVVAINDTKLRLTANGSTKDLTLSNEKLSNWNMYALSVFNQEGKTKICLYFNGRFMHMLTLNKEIADKLTTLCIGDKQLASGQTGKYLEANKTPIRIGMLSIGAYFYKKVNFKAIYDESRKFLFNSKYEDASSGVCFETIHKNDDDLISLNGSFTSLKKLSPLVVGYSDGSYKIDKSRNFEFDAEIDKHVYASFDGILKLNDKTGCRLTYKPLFANAKYVSLNFKPMTIDETEEKRTLLSFMDNNSDEKYSIYIDNNDNLCYSNGNISTSLNLQVNHDQWNTLVLSSDSITLNGKNVTVPYVELSDLITNVGCSIKREIATETPCNYLNGYICDILLSKDINSSIIHKGSVLSKYDTFGRKISTSISCDENTLNTTKYTFVSPTDSDGNVIPGRTSTLIKTESNDLLGDISYEYDSNNNITSITTNKGELTQIDEYEYDEVERLVYSSKYNGNEANTYEYDENGNILLHQIKLGDTVSKTKYVYADDNKEKLIYIVNENGVTNIDYSDNSLYPIKIGDTFLRWSLNQLVEITTPNSMIRNEFDYLNRRIKKNTKDTTTEYYYDQNKLIASDDGKFKKTFIYDEKDVLVGFIMDNGFTKYTFFYLRDQLDIIRGIIDERGRLIEQYEYDDFGLLINHDKVNLELNTILYKGYMYDPETKWYLLGERYYSPELKRFISPDKVDNILNSVSDLAQFNLFAYCDNNPIMRFDNGGQSWFKNIVKKAVKTVVKVVVKAVVIGVVVGTVVGGIVGGTAAMITSIKSGDSFGEVVAKTIKGIGEGAEIGFGAAVAGCTYLAGEMFNINILKEIGNMIFHDMVIPKAIEFTQENYIGLTSCLNGVHNLITSETALKMSDSCSIYTTTQALTAEENRRNNYKITGENDEKIILKPIGSKSSYSPAKLFNVVIDDKVYLTGQNADYKNEKEEDKIYEKIKFGVSLTRDNGCEAIATYNLLKYLDIPMNFAEVIYYYETRNLVFGYLGAFPQHIKELLDEKHVNYDFSYSKEEDCKEKDCKEKDCKEDNCICKDENSKEEKCNCKEVNYKAEDYIAMIQTSFNNKYEGEKKGSSTITNFMDTYFMIHTTFVQTVENYYCKFGKNPKPANKKFFEVNGGSGENDDLNGVLHYMSDGEKHDRKLITVFGIKK